MTFIPNPAFDAEFQREALTRLGMVRVAEELKLVVETIAPVGPTGDYKNSIEAGEDAISAFVTTKDFAGHIVEWGSVNNPPYAPIRRAVIEAGLTLHELPRP
jgi:hypothetical protein